MTNWLISLVIQYLRIKSLGLMLFSIMLHFLDGMNSLIAVFVSSLIKLVGDIWYNQVDDERDDYNAIQN